MKRHSLMFAGLLLIVGVGGAFAQYPPPQPFSLATLPPPLFVRFSGPPGVKVTFYRNGPTGQTFETPFTVGLRPGYAYRVEVSNMPGYPSTKIYPALEVCGSFSLPSSLKLSDHPVAIHFRPEDFASVLANALVTKVAALERPATAIPLATEADRPIEIDLPTGVNPYKAASERGRPLLVLKVGERKFTPEELAVLSIPGTMLLPGEQALPLPRDRPWLPNVCYPFYDPKIGPADAANEVLFWDGGDRGLPVGIGPDGRLRGLDSSDTVAEYQDSQAQKRVAVANRVCLVVPRFVVMRGEIQSVSHLALIEPYKAVAVQQRELLISENQANVNVQNTHLKGLAAGQRASVMDTVEGTAVVGRVAGLVTVTTLQNTGDITASHAKREEQPKDRPLRIIKWPDKCGAAIGEIVTFYLKYINQGGQLITNIVVSDSLTNRLEYVPGTARSDRDGVFTTQPNEAGSLILRWQINDPLPPQQSGTVSFQVRIR